MNKRKESAVIFKELLDHIGMSANKLSVKLGYSTNSFLYNIKNGKNNITQKIAQQITDIFEDINYTYLLTGIGTLTKNQSEPIPDNVYINTNGNKFTEKKDGSFDVTVRYLSFNRYNSYLRSLKDGSFTYDWDETTFCVDQFGKGNYLGFKTYSMSMNGGMLYDTPSGASLLGRELGKHHWEDGFRPSDSGWVILTEKNIFHKDITHFDKEKKAIICSSRNDSPEYVDFELQLDDVLQIFKVIKRTF